jgi:hypothetical protein
VISSDKLAYLATPYTKFPGSIHEAFDAAVRLSGLLMKTGLRIYSPIVHCHPIAMRCKLDPLDVEFWLAQQAPMMRVSDVLIVGKLPTWDASQGVAHEIKTFGDAGKPRYWCEPDTLMLRHFETPEPLREGA